MISAFQIGNTRLGRMMFGDFYGPFCSLHAFDAVSTHQ